MSTKLLTSIKWNQINNFSGSSTFRRVIIFTPPLILASYYICKRLYLYLKVKKKPPESLFYDACDYSTTNNSNSLNHSPASASTVLADNTDGCVLSVDGKKIIRPSLLNSSKCSYCKSQQKLSFKDSNILEQSIKNLSTTQLIKLSLDNLNNVNRTFEEMKSKQNILKDFNLETKNVDEKLEKLNEKLESMIHDLELLRNEFMPLTYGNNLGQSENADDDDDFDDGASYLSSATTTSLGYWDPEPNLHFFELYQNALKMVDLIKPPKADRTISTGCESYNDFLAKVHCLRQAFALLFTNVDFRHRYAKIGEEILRIVIDHPLRDPNQCIKNYYSFLEFVQNESNLSTIEMELEPRKIAMVSFYDIVLDYMILESFDDLENPPVAVKPFIGNQWLSASFREIALQTAISTMMRRKRSKLIVPNGFFEHFYRILDHMLPVLAWGFFGSDENLKFKCESLKDSTYAVIRDYFSFDRCRYTYLDDLCEDLKRVTEERFWELNNKLKILQDY